MRRERRRLRRRLRELRSRAWRAGRAVSCRAQLALLIGAFAAATLIALALGATNLGTALAFGQIAFAAVLVWLLLTK